MRIIPDDATEYQAGRSYVDMTPCYAIEDTIEITDNDWNEIYASYYLYVENNIQYDGTTVIMPHKTFAQYLRELVELKRYNRVTTLDR